MKFLYNDVLYVHTENFTEAHKEFTRLYDEKVPCIIWKKGTDTPWAAFPMERLLKA